MKNNCSIITVNYNSFLYTKNLIISLKINYIRENNLYIVDNFSSDNSYSKIFKLLKFNDTNKINLNNSKILTCHQINNIHLIRLRNNYGYASAVNIPLEVISKKNEDSFYWIINNDIEIESNTLQLLKEQYVSNSITTPMVYDLNNNNKIQSLGCKINSYFLTTKNIISVSSLNNTKIDYLSGVSLFFDDKVLEKVGLFSENYFMYYEDVDWSIRALSKGVKLVVNLDTKIFHNHTQYVDIKLKILSIYNRIRLCFKFYKYKIPLVFLYSVISVLFNLFRYIFIIKNVK
jgi:hypothetical protein